ncbi:MAG: tripartite tricarboxylate transporter substrate binding protein [Alphaproteobacteria bacterium]|nr:tripartite tricarboxylate transporter substrate binding protein [Alphaproteobacteria bacterium]
MLRRHVAYFLSVLAILISSGAGAADWPTKPVRLIVPFPAGGSTDVIGRIVAAKLGERMGQQFIVDNRAGASGTVGSESAARSPADGYTLLLTNIGSQGVGPAVFASVKYDTEKDFSHVAMIGTFTNALVVHPGFAAKSLGDLVALAKREPGKYNFATSGNGSTNHLLGEMLKLAAGIDLVHVPYRGAGPALADVLANQVPMMFDSLPSSAGHLKAGGLRALAVASAARLAALPDVPTFREQGFPDLVIENWFGISGPAGMAGDIVGKLAAEIKTVLGQADVVTKLAEIGLQARWTGPAEFSTFIKRDLAMWKDVVARAKVTVQ